MRHSNSPMTRPRTNYTPVCNDWDEVVGVILEPCPSHLVRGSVSDAEAIRSLTPIGYSTALSFEDKVALATGRSFKDWKRVTTFQN